MQRQSTSKAPPLHPAPVRGQLEPYDHRTAKGWRYIQTTNTPNQLKVLLPPGTASMYEQLLKFEEFELRKKSGLSWERLQEIRHLKDRMVRKCQRLVKASAERPQGGQFNLTFQTVVAPADFRVKEMEKWFLEQHKRTLATLKQKKSASEHPNSCKCIECVDPAALHTAFAPSGQPSGQRAAPMKPQAQLLYQQPRHPLQSASMPTRIGKSKTLPARYESSMVTTVTTAPLPTRVVTSPPPLPHLLRVRNLAAGYDLSDDPQRNASLPTSTPLLDPDPDISSISVVDSLPRSTEPDTTVWKVELKKRPSCIKRSSTGEFSKRVSWADNDDLDNQVSRYASVAREAHASGRKWEEIRDIYLEQMSGLATLHQQVGESLEHLRSESAHLRHADETIKLQREMLRSTFQEFERKQLRFQAKVQEALQNADNVLSLTTAKETAHV